MIGKKIRIDINDKKKYPKVIDKEEDAYLYLILEFEDGANYKAKIISMSSKGIYSVEVIEKY